jgi:hypothetical protein
LQAAKKPHAAYKPEATRGNADAYGIDLTSTFRNFCRSDARTLSDS